MTPKLRLLTTILASLLSQTLSFASSSEPDSLLTWQSLPALSPAPQQSIQPGLGGPFVGVHNGALLVAGGANFRDEPPWQNGRNAWYDDIYILPASDSSVEWLTNPRFKLPRPIAYGVAISTELGVVCIGGCDSSRTYAEVFVLKWHSEDRSVEVESLPPLPRGLAYAAGAAIDHTIFVAGGKESLSDPTSSNSFFALDLSRIDDESFAWRELPAWPGPPRIGATAVSQSDGAHEQFYLFGGRRVKSSVEMEALTDAYAFNPRSETWRRLSDISAHDEPRSILGAPGLASGTAHILIFGGADGRITAQVNAIDRELARLKSIAQSETRGIGESALMARADSLARTKRETLENHPGFSRDILTYHTITDSWSVAGELPAPSQITTAAVRWQGGIVIPSGEVRPGVRTDKVWKAEFIRPAGLGPVNHAVIGGYFLLLVAMGVYFSRREKTTADYFKAGGRIPWWAAGLSIFGTSLSAITFMAVPAKTFATDWLYFMGSMTQVAAAPLVVLLFLPHFRKLNVTSAYEFLEQRFSLTVRWLGSLAFISFQLGRIGIVLFLPAIALSVVTGIDIDLCIILVAVFSIIYTVLGGIEAVIWTDVLQVVVLIGGALVSLVLIVLHVDGGLSGLLQMAVADGKLRTFDFSFDLHQPTFWVVLIGGLATYLTSQSSDQTLVQRYLTTRDEKSAAKGLWTHGLMAIPSGLLFFGLGTALYVFFKSQPAALSPALDNTDAIFPWFIVTQLPNGLSGILIAAIFAASMSSLDSSMNSVATVVTRDFYQRLRPEAEDRSSLLLARWLTVVTGLLGMTFALMLAGLEIKSLWDAFFKIIGLFAGGLGGLFLLGVLSKRAHASGALIGFLGSGLTQYWISQTQAVHFLLYTLTGMAACMVIGYAISLTLPKDLWSRMR